MDINNHGYKMRKLYCLKTYHSKTYSFSYDRIMKLGAYEVYNASNSLYEAKERINAFLENHECPDGEIYVETLLIPEDQDWVEENDDPEKYETYFNNIWEKRNGSEAINIFRIWLGDLTGESSCVYTNIDEAVSPIIRWLDNIMLPNKLTKEDKEKLIEELTLYPHCSSEYNVGIIVDTLYK